MGLTYRNIVVAVDGSEEAEWAFKKGIEITKRNNADLHIVHVVELRSYPSDAASIKGRAEKYGTELLEKYKKMAMEQGIQNVDMVLEFGSPKVTITKKVAPKIKADLIVCGATGLYAVERLFIGSVSENITRSANCDVLVVRTQKNESE
ncbi:universal stress protein [Bacillus sp. S/N-304-OC-R1]|uniref:universal stress protein n=1 Tax=Bacillus sp. S/N-304-OC-R1 TaxID=2758034 RepID=UPI001C8D2DF7|nr:universal stress protein [Bacillus sp. S/N-304-OC-R1]MBY0122077.1 universal stress protein [Bacillus sp. S/N-304-OC-R1]